MESRQIRHDQVHRPLTEAAEAAAGDAEGGATNTMLVRNDTTAGMAAAESLMPHKTHNKML